MTAHITLDPVTVHTVRATFHATYGAERFATASDVAAHAREEAAGELGDGPWRQHVDIAQDTSAGTWIVVVTATKEIAP